jgi:hypothetical protein
MPDAFEEQAVLVAAEQAAAEGDAIAAEGHLRKLLDLQTARLGPGHPEVASTLHNLAVVCERAGRISEAEGLYRRAYTTASAALPPTDQLVIRCQEDLNALLDARTVLAQPPQGAGAHATAPGPAPARTPSGVRKPSPPPSRQPARPASRVRPPAPTPAPPSASPGRWIALAVGGALIAAAGIGWAMFGRTGSESALSPAAAVSEPAPKRAAAPAKKATPPPAPRPTDPAPGATTPPASSTSPEASTAPAEPPTPPAPTPSPAPEPPPTPAPTPPPEPVAKDAAPPLASDPEGIRVTDARLCRQLSTSGGWACTAPEEPVTAGRLYFLTRLDVSQTTEIEHRWYHGNAVIQSVRLRVPAAGRPGYRTYSRQTIPAARTGQWRVELRAPSGAVLQQVQFVVP